MPTTSLAFTIVLVFLIIGVVFAIVVLAHLISTTRKQQPKPRAPTSIVTYLELGIEKGYSREQLITQLLNKGWAEDVIEEALEEAIANKKKRE